MVLWDTSPPSSWSAGFSNKVAISCPNSLSLDLLARLVASSTSLDLVTVLSVPHLPLIQLSSSLLPQSSPEMTLPGLVMDKTLVSWQHLMPLAIYPPSILFFMSVMVHTPDRLLSSQEMVSQPSLQTSQAHRGQPT